MPTTQAPSYLTVKEAAARIGITPVHLYRLVENEKIAHFRFGGSIKLRPEDVDAFVASALRVAK